jgi:hypothetical protein
MYVAFSTEAQMVKAKMARAKMARAKMARALICMAMERDLQGKSIRRTLLLHVLFLSFLEVITTYKHL